MRVATLEETGSPGSSTLALKHIFLYDGWNVIAEINTIPTNAQTVATYLWGTDLSGSEQGAGGVGGLLLCHSDTDSDGDVDSNDTAHIPAYDGNGNIIAWLDDTANVVVRMDYSPFGQTISKFGDVAGLHFGFSTKYQDEETGLCYYGYRYYDANTGRWPSRDPIEERGGVNLYGFVGNDGVNSWDYLGMDVVANQNEGSGKNKADSWNGVARKIREHLEQKFKDDEKIKIVYYGGSNNAHTKSDIEAKINDLSGDDDYDMVIIGVFAHGQIVGKNYGMGDWVSKKEKEKKGHYLTMDSNVLSAAISDAISGNQKLKGLVTSCFMNPFYPNGNGRLEVPSGKETSKYPLLDLLAEPVYGTSGYGNIVDFKNLIDNVIDDPGGKQCKVAVAVFQGRYANTNPTNSGYE